MSINDPMLDTVAPAMQYSDDLYGKVEFQAKYMYTAKGEKPREFDEQNDDPRHRSTEFSISLTTIDAMGLTRPVEERRHLNWTPAWRDVVWKSVTELGYDLLRDLNGKFVKAERTPTGRTYTNKTTGKEVNETTLKFVKVYESEAACIRDYEDAAGVSHEASSAADDAATTVAKALIATANGDLKKLAINLKAAGSPYTVDSEFIVNLLKETAVAA